MIDSSPLKDWAKNDLQQGISSCGRVMTKLGGWFQKVTRTNRFDFGSGPDPDLSYQWHTKCGLFRLAEVDMRSTECPSCCGGDHFEIVALPTTEESPDSSYSSRCALTVVEMPKWFPPLNGVTCRPESSYNFSRLFTLELVLWGTGATMRKTLSSCAKRKTISSKL